MQRPPELTREAGCSPEVRRGGGRSPYSLRWTNAKGACCSVCHGPIACGAIGFYGQAPLCDACLIQACPQLGMVRLLILVSRAFAAVHSQGSGDRHRGLAELLLFIRIFDALAPR